jgi:hypothetical protein
MMMAALEAADSMGVDRFPLLSFLGPVSHVDKSRSGWETPAHRLSHQHKTPTRKPTRYACAHTTCTYMHVHLILQGMTASQMKSKPMDLCSPALFRFPFPNTFNSCTMSAAIFGCGEEMRKNWTLKS